MVSAPHRLIAFIILTLFTVTALFLQVRGRNSRSYLVVPRFERVELSQIGRLWQESGIKGRILLHFDRQIRIGDAENPGPEAATFVGYGIRQNYIRTVYQVIPDASWEEVRSRLAARRDVTLHGETFRVCIDGVSIRVMRLKDVPLFTEKVVLTINGDNWNGTDMEAIAGLLRRGGVKTDLMTVTGAISEQSEQLLRSAHAQKL